MAGMVHMSMVFVVFNVMAVNGDFMFLAHGGGSFAAQLGRAVMVFVPVHLGVGLLVSVSAAPGMVVAAVLAMLLVI